MIITGTTIGLRRPSSGPLNGYPMVPVPIKLAAAVLLVMSNLAQAGDWRFTPRFSLAETYTDNVRLVRRDKISDLITEITPGFSVRGTSARLKTNLDYNLQNLLYASHSEFNNTNHQLQGNGALILVENWLFLDARSAVSQQVVNSTGVFSRNNRSRTNNRGDVMSYGFVPRVKHNFADWVGLDFSYSYDRTNQTQNSNNGNTIGFPNNFPNNNLFFGSNIGSGTDRQYRLRLESAGRLPRTPIGVTLEKRKQKFDSGRSSELRRIVADATYVFSRKFRLTGTGGLEDNTFVTNGAPASGPSWTIGGKWTPTVRTTLSGNYGNRFFGPTYNVNLTHTRRRWSIDFGYNEEVKTLNQVQRSLVFVPLTGSNGQSIFDPFGNGNFLSPTTNTSLIEDTFVSRDLRAGFSYKFIRDTFKVSYNDTERDYQSSNTVETLSGVSLGWTHKVSPRASTGIEAGWRNAQLGAAATPSTYVEFQPYFSYQLGPHIQARVDYQYNSQDGDANGNAYVENAVTARLNFYY